MVTFRTLTDIPADRQVVVRLPPETPLGKAELVITVAAPSEGKCSGENLRSLFGSIRSGDPRSGDAAAIEADLARSYGDSVE